MHRFWTGDDIRLAADSFFLGACDWSDFFVKAAARSEARARNF
jgi:hypothetical protein